MADDALRVLDAAGVRQAVVCGYSMGCQVAVEIQRRAPERVVGLALLLGPAGRVFDTALGPAGTALRHLLRITPGPAMGAIMPGLARAGQAPVGPWLGRKLGFLGGDVRPEDVAAIVGHWGRLHGPSVRHLALSAAHHDVRDHLQHIHVPTLIVAGDLDVFAPARKVGRALAGAIPGARYVHMPHGTHSSTLEHADEILEALERFLADGVRPASSKDNAGRGVK